MARARSATCPARAARRLPEVEVGPIPVAGDHGGEHAALFVGAAVAGVDRAEQRVVAASTWASSIKRIARTVLGVPHRAGRDGSREDSWRWRGSWAGEQDS